MDEKTRNLMKKYKEQLEKQVMELEKTRDLEISLINQKYSLARCGLYTEELRKEFDELCKKK